jgi:hypothetical protein
VVGRVAQGPGRPGRPGASPAIDPWLSALVAGGLFLLALWVYWWPGNDRYYDHFVWQALAFLDGRAAIDWPVAAGPDTAGNAFFQDVMPVYGSGGQPTGRALLPFPPLPAIVLLPIVAMYGVATDEQAVSVVLGALDVVLCWWMLGRLAVSTRVRLVATLFFAFGTVFWYAAQLGTTWFFAHVVAIAPLFVAVGLALEADPRADEDVEPAGRPTLRGLLSDVVAELRAPIGLVDGRQFVIGVLFGLACTARLPIALGAPFFMLVGSGRSWVSRSISAGLGALLPLGLLAAYNLASTGHLFHPAYEYQYRLETYGWPALGYRDEWAIEDLRYIPQNVGIAFLSGPVLLPEEVPLTLGGGRPLCLEGGASRGYFDFDCPLALPRDTGMSVLLTSPAYLLAVGALRRFGRSRIVLGASLAVVAIVILNLAHFSQGWVQFGWRFSNDIVVFALPLVALGLARRGGLDRLALALLGLSLLVNHWGVTWGNELGW